MKDAADPKLEVEALREALRREYEAVACEPRRGFHFHTGRPLAARLQYEEAWLQGLPAGSIESFAGTANPFRYGPMRPGERVVDLGCGAGLDSLIAARMVGSSGHVIGVDMTPAMLEKARAGARDSGMKQIEFRQGYLEDLPVHDAWADVVISNGVLNLVPDKLRALREAARVLRLGGRIQIGDVALDRPVGARSKERIDLWTG